MAYKDCFAYRDRDCCILTERVCDRRRCTFFKTKEEHDEPGNTPNEPPAEHRKNEGKVNGQGLAAEKPVEKTGEQTVGGKLKGHGKGGEQRRHGEKQRTEKGSDDADGKSPTPPQHKAAQKYRNMHGQQHAADLGDLCRQKGKHKPEGKKQRRKNKVAQRRVTGSHKETS